MGLKFLMKIAGMFACLFLAFALKIGCVLAFDSFGERVSVSIGNFIDNQSKILHTGDWGSYLIKREKFGTYYIYDLKDSYARLICKIILKEFNKYYVEISKYEKPIDGFYKWEVSWLKVRSEHYWMMSPQNGDDFSRKVYIRNILVGDLCRVIFSNEMLDMDGRMIKEEVFSVDVRSNVQGEILDIFNFWLSLLWIRFVGLVCL